MPSLPDVSAEVIATDTRFREAMNRIWALAGRLRFAEAEVQLLAIVDAPDSPFGNTDRAAKSLCTFAKLHALDEDPTAYRWFRERGIGMWYAWGAGATSGGEGSAREVVISAAEREFIDVDRSLGR